MRPWDRPLKAIVGATGDQPDDPGDPPPLPPEIHLAIVLPNIPLPIASDLMMAIDTVVAEHGYTAVVHNTGGGYLVSARKEGT